MTGTGSVTGQRSAYGTPLVTRKSALRCADPNEGDDRRGTMLAVEDLDGRRVLSAGGWDPRYAVTLAVASCGDVGAVLIDTNGDEADIDLDVYRRDAAGVWQEISSSVVGDGGGFLSGEIAVILGRTEPGRIVDIEYAGRRSSTMASLTGWWLSVNVAVPGVDDFPRLIGTRPTTV